MLLLGKIGVYLMLLSLILSVFFIGTVHAEDLGRQDYIDIIEKVHKLELETNKLQQEIEVLGEENEKYDSLYTDIKKQYNELTTEIKLLAAEQEHISQVLSQRIASIEIPNNRTSRILNTIITIGTLLIGAIGIASISGYIKSKIESISADRGAKNLKNQISKEAYDEVYADIYKQYSGSLTKINGKINEIYQYKPVLAILNEMGDKHE